MSRPERPRDPAPDAGPEPASRRGPDPAPDADPRRRPASTSGADSAPDAAPRPSQEIPSDRLPEGFAQRLGETVRDPAVPRPAATAVLLREGRAGELELLLLRRTRSAGFVPGAYVFPGGRVDPADARPELLARLTGEGPEAIAGRLGLTGAEPPAAAYLLAAVRETFEETGLLPGVRNAAPAPVLREALLEGRTTFHAVLEELDVELVLGPDRSAYIAHWVTPRAEPRRYDTRFFAFAIERGLEVRPHAAEIAEARWLAPSVALGLHEEGKLPMVFPTIRTLEGFRGFGNPSEALAHFRGRAVPRIEPRLVRTPTGVGIEVPEEE